jgi:hypothetical protein
MLVFASILSAQTAQTPDVLNCKPVAGGTATAATQSKWTKSRARMRKVAKVVGKGTMIGLECLGAGAVFALEIMASGAK